MWAFYRKIDGRFEGLTHTWEFDHIVKETEDGLQVDDHHIDGAELVRVESMATYKNGGDIPEEDEEPDGAINRIKAVLSE